LLWSASGTCLRGSAGMESRLRRKLGNWAYRSLSEKVKVLAQREGIEVVK
jgi:transposase